MPVLQRVPSQDLGFFDGTWGLWTLGQLSGLLSYRKTIYGPNVIGIPVKSYLQLLVDEVKHLVSATHGRLSEWGQWPQPERPG